MSVGGGSEGEGEAELRVAMRDVEVTGRGDGETEEGGAEEEEAGSRVRVRVGGVAAGEGAAEAEAEAEEAEAEAEEGAEAEWTLEGLPRHVLVSHVLPRLSVAGVCSLGACSRKLREAAGQNDFWRTEGFDRLSREFKPGRVPVQWQRCVVSLVDHLARRRVFSEKVRFACLRASHVRAFRYSGIQAAVEAGDVPGVLGQLLARCHKDIEPAEGEAAAAAAPEAPRGSVFLGWRRSSQVAPDTRAPVHKGFASGEGAFRSPHKATWGPSVHGLLAEILERARVVVNRPRPSGAWPLHAAVRNADATMVRLLLALGADADVVPGAERTSALAEATSIAHTELDPSPYRLEVLAAFTHHHPKPLVTASLAHFLAAA